MKFLFRSSDALCLPQCMRVASEGNKVRLCVADPGYEQMGNGFVEQFTFNQSMIDWADCIVYDTKDDKLSSEADKVRRSKPTIGASELGGQLEHDREFGIEFARQHGGKVPEYESFRGAEAFRKAREYLQGKPADATWVFKVNKKHPEGVGTYVAREGRGEMLRMLEYYANRYYTDSISPNFVLCQKISGVEVSTEAWFNGHDWELPNHTIERTRFFPGDIGEKVGCTGNLVWPLPDAPLFKKCLEPLGPSLEGRFVGPLDINCIIEEKTNEPTFLEYSPRFGYDAIFALMELFESDFGEFLYQIATGQRWTGQVADQCAGDVRVTVPPFPAKSSKETAEEAVGVPIFGLTPKSVDRSVHLIEAMLDEKNRPITSGPHGVVLSVTSRGDSPEQAMDATYQRLKRLHIPNMRYRNDLTKTIADIYNDLEGTGWLANRPVQPKIALAWPGMSRARYPLVARR